MSSQSVLGFCGKIYPYSFIHSPKVIQHLTRARTVLSSVRINVACASRRHCGQVADTGPAGLQARLPAADSPAWLAPSPPRLQTHLSTPAALGRLPLAITQRGPKSESRRGPSLLPGLSVQPLRPEPWSRPRFLPSPPAPGRSVHTRARALLLPPDTPQASGPRPDSCRKLPAPAPSPPLSSESDPVTAHVGACSSSARPTGCPPHAGSNPKPDRDPQASPALRPRLPHGPLAAVCIWGASGNSPLSLRSFSPCPPKPPLQDASRPLRTDGRRHPARSPASRPASPFLTATSPPDTLGAWGPQSAPLEEVDVRPGLAPRPLQLRPRALSAQPCRAGAGHEGCLARAKHSAGHGTYG